MIFMDMEGTPRCVMKELLRDEKMFVVRVDLRATAAAHVLPDSRSSSPSCKRNTLASAAVAVVVAVAKG